MTQVRKAKADHRRAQVDAYATVARALVQSGAVDPEGKSADDVAGEVRDFLLARPDLRFTFVLDHRMDLLKQARAFFAETRAELACVFYATWTEHHLNSILASACDRRRLSESTAREILRVSVAAKLSWLPEVLGLPTLNAKHRSAILAVADARNSFVHYKWQGDKTGSSASPEEVRARKALEHYSSTVRYLQAYERRVIFKRSKRRISRRSKPAA